ncbi:MAG: ABC transporter substrate-binding protein [Galbitalea sp.]
MTFLLNYGPGGSQFGFTYAKQLGLYKKAGLNVEIEPGTGSIPTAQQVAAGKVDLGYSDPPSAFSVVAAGGPLKVISPVQQVNAFAVIWLKSSGIKSVKDLAGKRVGFQPGTGNGRLFQAVLSKNKVPYSSIVPVNITSAALEAALRGGQVDAGHQCGRHLRAAAAAGRHQGWLRDLRRCGCANGR